VNTIWKNSATIFTILAVVGCASTPSEEKTASGEPVWVMNPTVEDGYVDTQCVADNANMGLLKQKATALARAEIARQVELQVKTLGRTKQELVEGSVESASTKESFESAANLVGGAVLIGSHVTKAAYVDFPDGTRQLCVMVTVDAENTSKLYESLADSLSGDATEKENIVREFAALKVQQDMEAELNKKN
jgi:hypothetical protein